MILHTQVPGRRIFVFCFVVSDDKKVIRDIHFTNDKGVDIDSVVKF